MILELIKDSPGFQLFYDMAYKEAYQDALVKVRSVALKEAREEVVKESHEEARQFAIRVMSKQIARRFPAFAATEALEPLTDLASLEQLGQELEQFDTVAGLQARIAELTAKKETPTQ